MSFTFLFLKSSLSVKQRMLESSSKIKDNHIYTLIKYSSFIEPYPTISGRALKAPLTFITFSCYCKMALTAVQAKSMLKVWPNIPFKRISLCFYRALPIW